MTNGNQTSTRFKDEIGIISPWAFFIAFLGFLSMVVVMVVLVGRDQNAPPVAVRWLLGIITGARARLLYRADWLCKPGRGTARYEPLALDAHRSLCPQRSGNRPLFCFAQAAHHQLSSMWCDGRAGLWFLSQVPLPPAAGLPALPARRESRRQVLPVLRWVPGGDCQRAIFSCAKPTLNFGGHSAVLEVVTEVQM